MPEGVKQFLIGQVLPILVGIVTAWLTIHVHLLTTFHIGTGSVARDLTMLGVWAISAGLSWLGTHHILRGTYSEQAKAARLVTRATISEREGLGR